VRWAGEGWSWNAAMGQGVEGEGWGGIGWALGARKVKS